MPTRGREGGSEPGMPGRHPRLTPAHRCARVPVRITGPERTARMEGRVLAVAKDADHRFSKRRASELRVLPGLGVEGDAHQGVTVKHRSRVAADPTQPNLRQVHLIHAELFGELERKGFAVGPADLGENITTEGVDLLALPRGAFLRIGGDVVLEVTGLRNPCAQIERFRPGLLAAVLDKGPKWAKSTAARASVSCCRTARLTSPLAPIPSSRWRRRPVISNTSRVGT